MIAIPRPFPWIATLCVLAGISVLCMLGHWQQERLVWKQALQASLDREFTLPAKDLPILTSADLDTLSGDAIKRGVLKGRFDFDHQIALQGQIAEQKSVVYHIVPLLTADGRTIFVIAAYSEGMKKLPTPTTRGKIDQVTGVAKAPSWNRFTPDNAPDKDLWFRADPKQMAEHLKLPNPVPVIFYAEFLNYKLDALPQVEVPRKLRNDHEQYAMFWYAMAGVLFGIYILRFWRKPSA